MANPFQQIISSNTDLNRIQANVTNALNQATGATPVTSITTNQYNLSTDDEILVMNTTQISPYSSTVSVLIQLPSALTCNGFLFRFKKQDTSSNVISFVSSGMNRQNVAQTIEGAASPYNVSTSLAHGALFSDGNNWWVG